MRRIVGADGVASCKGRLALAEAKGEAETHQCPPRWGTPNQGRHHQSRTCPGKQPTAWRNACAWWKRRPGRRSRPSRSILRRRKGLCCRLYEGAERESHCWLSMLREKDGRGLTGMSCLDKSGDLRKLLIAGHLESGDSGNGDCR